MRLLSRQGLSWLRPGKNLNSLDRSFNPNTLATARQGREQFGYFQAYCLGFEDTARSSYASPPLRLRYHAVLQADESRNAEKFARMRLGRTCPAKHTALSLNSQGRNASTARDHSLIASPRALFFCILYRRTNTEKISKNDYPLIFQLLFFFIVKNYVRRLRAASAFLFLLTLGFS